MASYEARQAVLVVGDGDFSFSRGLLAHMMAKRTGGKRGKKTASVRLVATSYDSEAVVAEKYPTSRRNIRELTENGVNVRHGVDGTNLAKSFDMKRVAFDRIIFNFPHTGQQRVHLNRALLAKFFKSAALLLKRPAGEIHVTLKLKPPYSNWGADDLAADAGLIESNMVQFDPAAFPGYAHQTTLKDAKKFEASAERDVRHCKTIIFQLAAELAALPDARHLQPWQMPAPSSEPRSDGSRGSGHAKRSSSKRQETSAIKGGPGTQNSTPRRPKKAKRRAKAAP